MGLPPTFDAQLLLQDIIRAHFKDKKRTWVFRVIRWVIYMSIVVFFGVQLWFAGSQESSKPHVGLIDIRGEIFDTQAANADDFAKGMEEAYKSAQLKGLIIRINSPGGSPVQADDMYNTIQYYRKKYPKIPVYAVCTDMCASAAYYIAAGAENIYANPASIVGSIGVLYNGFGFVDTIAKLGVTRRLQTAGVNKAFLDPFLPENPEQKVFLQKILDIVHAQFIHKVELGRGTRLGQNQDMYSGLFWTGVQAKTMGLIDGFASAQSIARDHFHTEHVVDYTNEQNVLERMSRRVGTSLASNLVHGIKDQAGVVAVA